jgi:hypothetical protein
MAPSPVLRRPVSTRHAFALAFDLTLLRDPLHSMFVPFLLRAPWVLAGALLPAVAPGAGRSPLALLSTLVLLGGSISWWAVDAMLRVRARSVFNTPHAMPPAPAGECYRAGLARLPWLYATEFVRGVALAMCMAMFVVPTWGLLYGIWLGLELTELVRVIALAAALGLSLFPLMYLGYKLAFATEAVVLNDRNLFGAFEHSAHLARGRFERWFEMVAVSVVIVLGVWFAAALLYVAAYPRLQVDMVIKAFGLLLALLWPVFQYAWTFFYLRLIEVEEPQIHESGPFKASSGMVGPWSSRGAPRPRPAPEPPVEPMPKSFYDGD